MVRNSYKFKLPLCQVTSCHFLILFIHNRIFLPSLNKCINCPYSCSSLCTFSYILVLNNRRIEKYHQLLKCIWYIDYISMRSHFTLNILSSACLDTCKKMICLMIWSVYFTWVSPLCWIRKWKPYAIFYIGSKILESPMCCKAVHAASIYSPGLTKPRHIGPIVNLLVTCSECLCINCFLKE